MVGLIKYLSLRVLVLSDMYIIIALYPPKSLGTIILL